MDKNSRLVIGLNTKYANDASGHRTSAIFDYLENTQTHLYVLEQHEGENRPNTHFSRLGYMYKKAKSNNLLRLLLEIILAFEFILTNRQLIRNTEWIWISSPPYIFSLIILTYLKRKKKKVLFDIKDIYPEVFEMTGLIKKNNFIYKYLLKFTHKQLTDVTVVGATAGIVKYYKQCLKSPRIFTLLNGSDIKASDVDKVDDVPFTVIFHGRLGKLQNVEMMKNLMLDLPYVTFLILSDDILFLQELRPLNVREIGTKSGSQLVRLIQQAHLGLCLRDDSELTKISNPVKIFDYIACGTPVVSSPYTEIEHHLGGSGLLKTFEYNKTEEIKNFIERLSSDINYYFEVFPNAGKINRTFQREKIVNDFFIQNNDVF